jgi:8-oxo-dGTP diphosphatase
MSDVRPHCYAYPHPAVTTDIVLFTIRNETLQLLLIRRGMPPFQECWALPGGFLDIDEDLDCCAARELREETGVDARHLDQLCTFGAVGRDPRERVISVAYFALVPCEQLALKAGDDAADARWFAFSELPALAFDHAEIIRVAHQRLISKLDYSSIAFQFLPETFTLAEMQRIYEILVDVDIDKRNFRKWALALPQIEETGELRRRRNRRPARVYRMTERDRVAYLK